MHKNLVLFSDGTGNSSGKLYKTNVWRTYEAVDVADPRNPALPRQFAFYDDGVGTSSFKPLAVLGGAMGLGLARNVRDIYAFVCRNYAPGDKIYAFGFSRGAFTIRVVVGLILDQGLVRYNGDEAELDRMVHAAYRAHRATRYKAGQGLLGPLRTLRDRVIAAWDRVLGRSKYQPTSNIGRPKQPDAIQIEFLGLWDTVDAYGLPIDELTRAVDKFIWPLTMPDLNLNQRVKRACHALAIDDERNTFHPRVWNEATEPNENRAATHIDSERITQVWFAGVHSDVGGGYPNDSLSYVSLVWVIDQAAKCQLRFVPRVCARYRALMDENGPIHDSRRGLAGYYRYNPRRIEWLSNQKLAGGVNVTVPRPKVHESVLRRIQSGNDGYAPFALPPTFAVARFDGSIADVASVAGPGVSAPAFLTHHQHVWNWVWWRRLTYFVTLAMTLTLLVLPLVYSGANSGACTSRLCFLSPLIDLLAPLLPAFAQTWTHTFTSHPGVFLAIVLPLAAGLLASAVLEQRIRDAMRAIWYTLSSTTPAQVTSPRPPRSPGALNRAVEWLRTRPMYRKVFRIFGEQVLPTALLPVVLYGLIAMLSQALFAVRSSQGGVCVGSPAAALVDPQGQAVQWDTRAFCQPTAVRLQQGVTYRLHFNIPKERPWRDATIAAGPNGLSPGAAPGLMALGVPLRRHMGQAWFKPMARIGKHGSDVYPLDPKPTVAVFQNDGGDTRFETEFVARSNGELFLYVNDAVLELPWLQRWSTLFYDNNQGSATLRIHALQPLPQ